MALEQLQVHIEGTLPLLMHSNQGVNPFHPTTKAIKQLTSRRKKTEEDIEQIARLEWELGLYFDEDLGPYLPAYVILACLRDAAKKSKLGKLLVEAVFLDDAKIPLLYDGPRDVEGMYLAEKFCDSRPVKVQTSTVNRTRPIFTKWAADFTVTYDATLINRDEVIGILQVAGQRIGLGDYRPTYGRFAVTVAA